jgi:hypothetical protein
LSYKKHAFSMPESASHISIKANVNTRQWPSKTSSERRNKVAVRSCGPLNVEIAGNENAVSGLLGAGATIVKTMFLAFRAQIRRPRKKECSVVSCLQLHRQARRLGLHEACCSSKTLHWHHAAQGSSSVTVRSTQSLEELMATAAQQEGTTGLT